MNPDLSLDLTALGLGAPAAERDIKRGLEHYFVESEAFKRVADRTKTIILGNRGSGKGAIFKMLAARERRVRHTHVVELAPEDYSYELLRETMLGESEGSWAKLGAYAVAWKYLIYVMVMKEVARDMPKSMSKGPAGKILRYVRDNHAHGQYSKLSALVSYLKRLEGIKIGPYEAGLRAKELERLYRPSPRNTGSNYPNLLEVFEPSGARATSSIATNLSSSAWNWSWTTRSATRKPCAGSPTSTPPPSSTSSGRSASSAPGPWAASRPSAAAAAPTWARTRSATSASAPSRSSRSTPCSAPTWP